MRKTLGVVVGLIVGASVLAGCPNGENGLHEDGTYGLIMRVPPTEAPPAERPTTSGAGDPVLPSMQNVSQHHRWR